MDKAARNWFDQGGKAYSQFRPTYPPELPAFLAGLCGKMRMAADIGCGNGQFTTALAEYCEMVIGIDPSADQIAHAAPHPRVRYQVGPAEKLDLEEGCLDLVTAAQAAHWFDLERFYHEVRRVVRPGGFVALISYGSPHFEGALEARFRRFDGEEIGPYWPPERKLVDSGYAGIAFPFAEIAGPEMAIRRDWTLAQALGYVGTWSALRNAREAGKDHLLTDFAEEFAALWGDPEQIRPVRWPIAMRLGKI